MKAKRCFYPHDITPFNKNSPKFGKAILITIPNLMQNHVTDI